MTQAVSNTLNNLQEMMTQVKQEPNKLNAISEVVSADKTTKSQKEFSNIFDKQVAKEEKINVKTLADVKIKNQDQQKNDNWANFQEIVSKISDEANVETALDLTLARDIGEIISQLKQAIDETVDETEDLIEKTDVVEDITTQTVGEEELLSGVISVDEELTAAEDENEDEDENVVLEQLMLLTANKNSSTTEITDKIDSLVGKDFQKTTQDVEIKTVDVEMLENFESLSAEDSVNNTKAEVNNTLEQILDEDILKELNIESVKAEVDNSGDGLMDMQTPEEQGVKAMLTQEFDNFDMSLEKVNNLQTNQTIQATPQAKVVDVNPSKILDQITRQLEGLQNNSKVNIVLNPEALGRVTIQLVKTGEGLSAQLTVANQEVRDMLMKGLDNLKETLLSQGVGVDNVTVKVSDTQKSEYNADWTEQEGSRGGNKEQGRSNREEKEKGLFEKMMAQTTAKEENGNV